MAIGVLTATLVVIISMVFARKYQERKWGKCKSQRSMQDKTVIITGANCGLGKATAEELAKRGAKVILACRDVDKAEKAMREIREKTRHGTLQVAKLDLASFASIKKFAKLMLETEEKIDVLINNAGVFQCPFALTEDGHETQFGVNYLGHFLLTNLLLDKLKKSAPSRIVNVTSALYSKKPPDLNLINSTQNYDKSKAYTDSKLANILFTRELSKRLESTMVRVYAVSPGMVWTNLGRHIRVGWLKMIFLAPFALFLVRLPKQGCQSIIHCAISEDVEGESGFYYRNCHKSQLRGAAKDDKIAVELWKYSEKIISGKDE